MDRLIASAAASASELPELLRVLLRGRSFIPVFSSVERFQAETRGSGFDGQGVSIDTSLLASMLGGTERIVLDPGSRTP